MKILALSNLYPPDVIGGYELGCKQAVDALRRRGHDALVLTTAPRAPCPAEPGVRRELRLGDVWDPYLFDHSRPITAHLLQAESALVSAFNVHALARAAADFGPDVVYAWNLVGIGGLGLMAAVQHLGLPWAWHLMDDVPLTLCRLAGRAVGPLLREVDRQLDGRGRFLACSRQLIDEIESGGVRLGDRAEVVPNWVVGDAPPPRARAYKPGDTLRIVSAGQINRDKGVDLLIEAAGLLVDRGLDRFEVDIYGRVVDGSFPALVHRLGLGDRVRFRGQVPQAELMRRYAEYDLFAFPTWHREPFGFAPLEAAWRGCVPLASMRSGFVEWFAHGVHCLKADRTAGAFADAIGSVLSGGTDLGPIARRAAATVGRDFHLDAIAPRIEATLARAADDDAGARRRPGPSAGDEAYRMALLAEKLAKVLVQEAIPVG